MKQAAIITVGNELLSGFTVDTNAAFLGRRLWELGVPLAVTFTVPDELEPITRALDQACQQADLILITGGLGPTDDDLTRHALAQFLGVSLTLRPELVKVMRAFFAQRQYEMPERNTIQAQLPAGAEVIANPHGTAPGIQARYQEKILIAMPGVPGEMKPMFEAAVVPQAQVLAQGQHVVIERLRCFGIGEGSLADKLGTRMDRDRNPLINCTVDYALLTLHVIARASELQYAKDLVAAEVEELRHLLGSLVFGTGDQTLAGAVGQALTQRGQTVATAESCTGGLIAKMLTDGAGASEFFNTGWITYSNASKIAQLGVSAELLDAHGAVSESVARAMAQGARERGAADFGLSITGIAGPTGGSPEKPVGLVFIGLCTPNQCIVEKCQFTRDRNFVRLRTAQAALNLLRQKLVF